MIDIHSHVIPFVDDGSGSQDNSLQLLKTAEENGVTDIVCTPHYRRFSFEPSKESILENFGLLSSANDTKVSLHLGQEIAYDKTINFFNTMDMDWDEAKDFKTKYQKALQELSGLDRSGEMTASSSGRVVFVHYAPGKSGTGFLLGVNVSKNPVKADFPKGVAAYESIPAEKEFGPFEYQIWTLE